MFSPYRCTLLVYENKKNCNILCYVNLYEKLQKANERRNRFLYFKIINFRI